MNLKKDFPFFEKNPKTVYLDSACMSLKPKKVIDAVTEYNEAYGSCAGRSNHKLSFEIAERMNKCRKSLRKFISARKDSEIVFNSGTTEGLNVLANHFKGRNVLISSREHNSNLIPWMHNCCKLSVVGEKELEFDLEDYQNKIKKVDVVSLVHKSNLDGYVHPIKEIVKIAKENNKIVVLDGAQSVPHMPVSVKKLDVDFMTFSGHKMLGPTSTGVLYGKLDMLKKLNPLIVGGGTVYDSTYKDYKFEDVPKKFEAGLQNYSGIFGLLEAVKYLEKIGMKKIEKHSFDLGKYLLDSLKNKIEIVGLKDYSRCGGIVNFNLPKTGNHDVSLLLEHGFNIMTRSGVHCVHSWFNKHKLPGSVRASFYLYNTKEDVDKFIDALGKVNKTVK